MPVTDVNKDLDALTMTITAEFDAGAERVWEMWSDPRQLERWWGPPSYPATFVDHDLSPDGLAPGADDVAGGRAQLYGGALWQHRRQHEPLVIVRVLPDQVHATWCIRRHVRRSAEARLEQL